MSGLSKVNSNVEVVNVNNMQLTLRPLRELHLHVSRVLLSPVSDIRMGPLNSIAPATYHPYDTKTAVENI